jgi:hypothetical protein
MGRGGGRGRLTLVTGEDGFAEFVFEGGGDRGGEFFGTGDDEFERAELLSIDATEVTPEEGGGGDEEGDAIFFDEFSEAFGVERGGVGDELDAFDDGIPKGDGAAEAVEKWEAAEDGVFGMEVEATAELGDVGDDVAVGEDDAFGIAGAAAGEEEEGFAIAAFFGDAEEGGDDGGGEDFGEEEPLGDLTFERG